MRLLDENARAIAAWADSAGTAGGRTSSWLLIRQEDGRQVLVEARTVSQINWTWKKVHGVRVDHPDKDRPVVVRTIRIDHPVVRPGDRFDFGGSAPEAIERASKQAALTGRPVPVELFQGWDNPALEIAIPAGVAAREVTPGNPGSCGTLEIVEA